MEMMAKMEIPIQIAFNFLRFLNIPFIIYVFFGKIN